MRTCSIPEERHREIEAMYPGKSALAISKEFGVTAHVIIRILRRRGCSVSPRYGIAKGRHQEVLAMYPQHSVTDIAKHFGVSHKIVSRILKANGVQVEWRGGRGSSEGKRLVCHCGKPVCAQSRECKFHTRIRRSASKNKCVDRKAQRIAAFVQPIQSKLETIAARTNDVIGVEAEYFHGWQYVMFYWQAAVVRESKESRFLGRVPARYQVEAVKQVLRTLKAVRKSEVELPPVRVAPTHERKRAA